MTRTEVAQEKSYFQLRSASGKNSGPIKDKRILIGRSEICDFILPFNEITSIHAVLEILPSGGFRLYDMDSKNGTFVDGKRIINAEGKIGSEIKFSNFSFTFEKYHSPSNIPLPLEMLDLPVPPEISQVKKIPSDVDDVKLGDVFNQNLPQVPRVKYPLAKDPKAEFSEYIFEDVETLYPIFKYDVKKSAVEIIILHDDRIYSVDYLPVGDGTYYLVGQGGKGNDLEFPYLGKKDKVPFVDMKSDEIVVNTLAGYEAKLLADEENDLSSNGPIKLNYQDIIWFSKGDLKIFVRRTDSPPKVAAAPIFRRDRDFKKYLLLMLLLISAFLGGISLIEVEEEVKKEELPKRIATILYKRRPLVSVNKAITKTENAPKEIAQKSPSQKPTPKKDNIPKVENVAKHVEKKIGSKTSKNTAPAKKAEPNKGPVDKKMAKVSPSKSSSSSKTKSSSTNQAQKSNNPRKSQGRVDTFKAVDFSSSVNSLLAKGGSTKSKSSVKTANGGESTGAASADFGESGATLKRAKVSNNIGSLAGAASGKLDSSKGVEGLVGKKSIYTAGLPYKEVVLGGMDPDLIRKILIDHIPQFRYCYQKELDTSEAAFHGIVSLNFVIGASGHVTKAIVRSHTNMPTTVRGCVVDVLKGIKFPEPRGGGVVEVNQPFNFYPKRN